MAKHYSAEVTSTAYKITKTLTAVQCDICKKTINAKSGGWGNDPDRYYEVTTGHRDWGNDSCDSIETRDICPDCIVKFVEEYLDECSNRDTAYLNIESECVYTDKDTRYVDTPPKEGEQIVEHSWYWEV